MMRLLLVITFSVLSVAFVPAHAVEIFKWNRAPLAIQLAVGHERIIFVDRNVSVGAPQSLQGKLRIQSVSGTVYLLANEQIQPSRLQLRDAESGEIILLDIATMDAPAPLEPAKIVIASEEEEARSQASGVGQGGNGATTAPSKTPAPVALTRYAAQMMYAPLRTVEALPGVRQVSVRLTGHLSTLAPTLDVDAVALGAWSLDKWTVTAVRLTNRRSGDRLELDPRHMQGDLYGATFQHSDLGPAGTAADTTMVYLVTLGKSLELALIPAPTPAGGEDE